MSVERIRGSWKHESNPVMKILWILMGSALMGFAIAATIKAGIGIDPLSAFNEGLSKHLNISVGWAARLVMLIILVFLFFIDRKRIGIGTVLNGFMVGTFADIFLDVVNTQASTFASLTLFTIGTVAMGVGIGLYVSADLGEAGIDAVMVLISSKTGKPVGTVRIILDILIGAVAFIIGGQVFIGTLISMIVNGPIINRTIAFFNKYLKWTIVQSPINVTIQNEY